MLLGPLLAWLALGEAPPDVTLAAGVVLFVAPRGKNHEAMEGGWWAGSGWVWGVCGVCVGCVWVGVGGCGWVWVGVGGCGWGVGVGGVWVGENLAVGQNRFGTILGVGAPPILVYFSWDCLFPHGHTPRLTPWVHELGSVLGKKM